MSLPNVMPLSSEAYGSGSAVFITLVNVSIEKWGTCYKVIKDLIFS